jgi:redox-sensing transcriptional repressor
MGFHKVFSENIADALDISSSLVRKDFASFNIKGIQKGGYQIEQVLDRIDGIIGYDEPQKVIIVGIGRIGEALMNYKGFARDNIRITAGFDNDTRKLNEKADPPIFHIDHLKAFVTRNGIKIAVLAVPEMVAQQTVEMLQGAGIEGILNFTPLKVKNTTELTVNNINIEHELANLIYFVNQYQNEIKPG